ncbi:MAG: hypothetical protein IJJ01_07935 [Firmicutes bacterium]|nr:hypothetical protein [Bacillota bacterium]
MSIKWAIIFLLLFAVASIGVGFIKGAIQQRRTNNKAAKNAPAEEKPADKEPVAKPEKKTKKKPPVKKPKRLNAR